MLITLGGKAGSGKGTIAKLLAEKIKYKTISIGDMKRELADTMGINIYDFNILGDKQENAKEFDLKYEEYQKSLQFNDKIILDSRLGFFAQPKAFKVLLDVEEEIWSKRILNAKRDTDKFSSPEEALEEVQKRNLNDQKRYQKLYDINLRDHNNYNLVIDTSERRPDEVVDIILWEFKQRKLKKGIADTPEEEKAIYKAKNKKSLLKNIVLLLALLLIAGFWIITTISANKQGNTEQENITNLPQETVAE